VSKLKFAVVGCGGRGRGHLRILATFPDVEVVAICDPVEASRDAALRDVPVPGVYADTDALLDAEELDGVVVATPPHLNAPAALPLLKAGVNTLLEKPPGLSVAETEELRDAAAESGALAMVGWNRRFNPIITRALAATRERGPVTQIVGEFHKSLTRIAASQGFPEAVLDNMILETTTHAVDTIRFLAGSDIVETHAISRRAVSEYKDIFAALVLFENGAVGHLISCYTGDARLERYELHGRDISTYMEGVSSGVMHVDGGQIDIGAEGVDSTREQDRYFADRVRDGEPIGLPAADLNEAVKTMQFTQSVIDGLRD
jgi:predicted dehydrogenase